MPRDLCVSNDDDQRDGLVCVKTVCAIGVIRNQASGDNVPKHIHPLHLHATFNNKTCRTHMLADL